MLNSDAIEVTLYPDGSLYVSDKVDPSAHHRMSLDSIDKVRLLSSKLITALEAYDAR